MPRHGADPLCGDGGGGRFGHRRFLGPTGGPDFGFPNSLIAAKITGNLRNFRSFRRWSAPIRPAISIACEEFPVVCGSGESPSSFNSLQAIPCCSWNRELLRRNREFHKASRKFRARCHGRPRRLSSSADPIRYSSKIVLPKLLRPAATDPFVLGRCADMVGAQTSHFDWLGHAVSRSYAPTAGAVGHAG
jgi:hypothetical protein